MHLTDLEISMLNGRLGKAVQKAMEILVALGKIYGAESMIPVSSVQISGVSYDNLGEAGLQWLEEMLAGGAKSRVLTTLNPAGMDIENWRVLGIDESFAHNQIRVIDIFSRMNVIPTCSCTPYLFGNTPVYRDHIAWAESSAVCYANSVIGARSNREGGPSALASSITGRTPLYGYHLDEFRRPTMAFDVQASLEQNHHFGVLGKLIGQSIEKTKMRQVPYLRNIQTATLEQLKSLSASIATYGGVALFHIEGITPEAALYASPEPPLIITQSDIDNGIKQFAQIESGMIDFVSLGCPHLSIREIARIAELLDGKTVKKEFWITTSRPVKLMADSAGYSKIIEASGAKFATDTCCVVAPIKGRFSGMATDSAKACYYANAKNKFRTKLLSFDDVIKEALK